MALWIERIATPLLLVLGLSQIYAPRWWQAYYIWLANQGRTGVRFNGFVSLTLGLPVAVWHNVWSGPPLLLTLLSWFLLAEFVLCLLAPEAGLRALRDVESPVRARIIRGTGVALVVLGLVLAINLYSAES